jgi:hypothetical protein
MTPTMLGVGHRVRYPRSAALSALDVVDSATEIAGRRRVDPPAQGGCARVGRIAIGRTRRNSEASPRLRIPCAVSLKTISTIPTWMLAW